MHTKSSKLNFVQFTLKDFTKVEVNETSKVIGKIFMANSLNLTLLSLHLNLPKKERTAGVSKFYQDSSYLTLLEAVSS